ncbi:MAG TPA: polyphenol oxidase family protein [Micrococcaceae bacterium]|jgi:hypothetical protein|nr:polyphenol oxidase family protein [Micrococcaceae bacterium]
MFWWHREVSPGVRVAFTDAGAGNLAFHVGGDPDAVGANRAALEAALETEPGAGIPRLQFMDQVHGSTVAEVARGDYASGTGPTADAMVSADVPLAVMVADCVPVVLLGRMAGGVPLAAVAHAGRPGVASQVVPKTVAAMRSRGAEGILAWLGPSVCGECYEVPGAMRAQVAAIEPASYATTRWGTPALDLPAAVLSQLAALGVPAERIQGCTFEERALFSYRRDGNGSRAGRIAGVVYAGG